MHLEPLPPQLVDRVGRVGLAILACRNDPAVRRAALPLLDGALVLQPVVLEIQLAVPGDVTQREERGRLLDVDVVARAPVDRRQRRIRPEPLAARRGGGRRHHVWIGPVALDLVEAADRVVAVRDEEHVVRHPAVIEAVGPDAGHAALGHLDHVVLGEHPPLVDRDGIDRLVVRPGAGRRVQIRLRLVQVVQDGRASSRGSRCSTFRVSARNCPMPSRLLSCCTYLPQYISGSRAHPRAASC